MREIANIGVSSIFSYVKIGLMIIFVAVIFATIFATLKNFKIDIVAQALQFIKGKKGKAKKQTQNAAFNKGVKDSLGHYTTKPSGQPCENEMCSYTVDAAEHGTVVRSGRRRLIVCAECAPAYVKTGWIPEITWGEDFKSAAVGLLLGGATRLNSWNPTGVFQGIAPPSFNFYLLLLRLGLYATAVMIIFYLLFVWRRDTDE